MAGIEDDPTAPPNTDSDDDLHGFASEREVPGAPTAEEYAAMRAEDDKRRAELVEKAKVAVDAARAAAYVADEKLHTLRDMQWLQFSTAHDVEVWKAIIEATRALPKDATHQEIALAQACAIADTRQAIKTRIANQMAAHQAETVAAVTDFEEKRAAADKACALANPKSSSWAAAAIGGLTGGLLSSWLMSGIVNKIAKGG